MTAPRETQIHQLSWPDTEGVRRAMEAFCPYPADLHTGGEPLLLKVEKEAFDTGGRHRAVWMWAVGRLRAYVYVLVLDADGRVVDLEVVKASEQGLGQLLPPPGSGPHWIDEAAAYFLRKRLRLEAEEPPGWDAPAQAIVPVTAPGEALVGGRNRRPWTTLVVARPHPLYGPLLRDGRPALPAAIWHEDFDWRTAGWFDYRSGEPIHERLMVAPVGTGPTYGRHAWILSYRHVIAKHFAHVPDHVVGPDGVPATARTIGILSVAPMEAHRVRLIGREANSLDRTGVTMSPLYSDYTEEAKSRDMVLAVLRHHRYRFVVEATGFPVRTVKRFLQTGRTSSARWSEYVDAAGKLATDALMRWDLSVPIPEGSEARCFLYMREAGRNPPTCVGCGKRLHGRQRAWCSGACRSLRTRAQV